MNKNRVHHLNYKGGEVEAQKKKKSMNPKEGTDERKNPTDQEKTIGSTVVDSRNKLKYISNSHTCNGLNA